MSKPDVSNICIFCGPTNADMSEEHIFSRWISKKLRSFGIEMYEGTHIRNGSRRPYKTGAIELTSGRVVCRPCNNEWLGGIERTELAPFFFEVIRGKPSQLSSDEQAALTFWLTRLSMAYEFAREISPRTFFTQAEREQFRADGSPPKHTRIWVTSYAGPMTAYVGQSNIYPSATGPHDKDLGDCIHVTTGTIGRFAFQVWSRKWKRLNPTDDEVGRALAPYDWLARGITSQLWPASGKPLTWPLTGLADNGTLKNFADRFGGTTTF